MISQKRLKEMLHYSPETGVFVWKKKPADHVMVGASAGTLSSRGYIQIKVDRVRFSAHRLVWFYMTGVWPENHIDHINGVKSDNRYTNLRDVTNQINGQNQRNANARNKSGYLGVSQSRGKYMAHIKYGGKCRNLGRFETPEEAYKVYLKAKRKHHKGCTI